MSESPKLEQSNFFDKIEKVEPALAPITVEIHPKQKASAAGVSDRLSSYTIEELYEMQDKASEGGWSNGYSSVTIQNELVRREGLSMANTRKSGSTRVLSPSEFSNWAREMQKIVANKSTTKRTRD